jgi:hypothetical protein
MCRKSIDRAETRLSSGNRPGSPPRARNTPDDRHGTAGQIIVACGQARAIAIIADG